MPIVTIQITREGTTPEQKAALIKGATDLLADVLNKPPGLTFVVTQEVELEGGRGRRVRGRTPAGQVTRLVG
jgi:4-oxalocrotonate tautomerase